MAETLGGCGEATDHAHWKFHCDGCGSGKVGDLKLLSFLLYPADGVLLRPIRDELTVIVLQLMNKVAASLGLRINASKIESLPLTILEGGGSGNAARTRGGKQ